MHIAPKYPAVNGDPPSLLLLFDESDILNEQLLLLYYIIHQTRSMNLRKLIPNYF